MALSKEQRRLRIKRRIRKKVAGSAEKPRLSVYRSNKQIYAQIIDDESARTLAMASSLKDAELQGIPKSEQAKLVGKKIGKLALEAGIKEVVFDRNGYLYHGRVKSLADSVREAGLKF